MKCPGVNWWRVTCGLILPAVIVAMAAFMLPNMRMIKLVENDRGTFFIMGDVSQEKFVTNDDVEGYETTDSRKWDFSFTDRQRVCSGDAIDDDDDTISIDAPICRAVLGFGWTLIGASFVIGLLTGVYLWSSPNDISDATTVHKYSALALGLLYLMLLVFSITVWVMVARNDFFAENDDDNPPVCTWTPCGGGTDDNYDCEPCQGANGCSDFFTEDECFFHNDEQTMQAKFMIVMVAIIVASVASIISVAWPFLTNPPSRSGAVEMALL